MQFSLHFKKYFNLVKIQFLALGLWPYDNGKRSNIFKIIWIAANVISLISQVILKINKYIFNAKTFIIYYFYLGYKTLCNHKYTKPLYGRVCGFTY